MACFAVGIPVNRSTPLQEDMWALQQKKPLTGSCRRGDFGTPPLGVSDYPQGALGALGAEKSPTPKVGSRTMRSVMPWLLPTNGGAMSVLEQKKWLKNSG